jgi:hypothetical protein
MSGSATRACNVEKGLILNNVKVTVVAGFPHYLTRNVPKPLRKRSSKDRKKIGEEQRPKCW